MTQQHFERQVSDRMEGYRVVPSPEVWTRVEAAIRRRRRRRFLWWWLPGILIGVGLIRFAAFRDPATPQAEQHTIVVREAAKDRQADLSQNIRSGSSSPQSVTRSGRATGTMKAGYGKELPGGRAWAARQPNLTEKATRSSDATVMFGSKHAHVTTPPVGDDPGNDQTVHPEQRSPDAARASSGERTDPPVTANRLPITARTDTASLARSVSKDERERTTDLTSSSDTTSGPRMLTEQVSAGSIKNKADSSRWIRSISLGGGLSSIGGNLSGTSGIGFSYGMDMQWYRPIGQTRFGFSAGLGIQGFTTKAGGTKSNDLFAMSANLTTGTFDPQSLATGMRWLHRIEVPLRIHLNPGRSKKLKPSIAAGVIPGYVLHGPDIYTPAGPDPVRRWQWALSLEATAPLSNRSGSRTRQFLRLQAGLTDLWDATYADGSRTTLLQWGIRKTLR